MKRLEKSGSWWFSHVIPIISHLFRFIVQKVRQWRIVHVLERILESSIYARITQRTEKCVKRDGRNLKRKIENKRKTEACDKSKEEHARCRWSTTAEDHLQAAMGQGWSEPSAYAHCTLDSQLQERLQTQNRRSACVHSSYA